MQSKSRTCENLFRSDRQCEQFQPLGTFAWGTYILYWTHPYTLQYMWQKDKNWVVCKSHFIDATHRIKTECVLSSFSFSNTNWLIRMNLIRFSCSGWYPLLSTIHLPFCHTNINSIVPNVFPTVSFNSHSDTNEMPDNTNVTLYTSWLSAMSHRVLALFNLVQIRLQACSARTRRRWVRQLSVCCVV